MGSLSINTKSTRLFSPHPHLAAAHCTRTHQIGALILVAATFFLTRLLDHSFGPCSSTLQSSFSVSNGNISPQDIAFADMNLKIYVYDEDEIESLKLLMYGRDGKISADACVKGQWGSQESGAGAHLFKSWAAYLNRSIILTPEGDRTDKRDISAFDTWKDIIIPGNVDDGMTAAKTKLVDPLPLSKRKYLATYLGRAQGKVGRMQLIELAKQNPDKLESPDLKFSGPDKLGRTEYFQHLRNGKFCLAPRGESSWTLRFYESFFVECVPVILSDQIELPFQNVVDYTQISIKWPLTRIGPPLLEYLESIPDTTIEELIANGRRVRCLWVYAPDSASCSAFSGILWELQKKVRRFHQSSETFWLHNGSIVNRDLVEFKKWKPPMLLP